MNQSQLIKHPAGFYIDRDALAAFESSLEKGDPMTFMYEDAVGGFMRAARSGASDRFESDCGYCIITRATDLSTEHVGWLYSGARVRLNSDYRIIYHHDSEYYAKKPLLAKPFYPRHCIRTPAQLALTSLAAKQDSQREHLLAGLGR